MERKLISELDRPVFKSLKDGFYRAITEDGELCRVPSKSLEEKEVKLELKLDGRLSIYIKNFEGIENYRVRIFRKKKRHPKRGREKPPQGAKRTHSAERLGGYLWTRYYETDPDEGFGGIVLKDEGKWVFIDVLRYLYFVVRDPDNPDHFKQIGYKGCPKIFKHPDKDHRRIYQCIALGLEDMEGKLCSELVYLKHNISVTKEGEIYEFFSFK